MARTDAATTTGMWHGAGWSSPPAELARHRLLLAAGRYASALIDAWVGRPVAWVDAGVDVHGAVQRSLA